MIKKLPVGIRRFYTKFLFGAAVVVWNVVTFPHTFLRWGINGLIEDWFEDIDRIKEFNQSVNKVIKD